MDFIPMSLESVPESSGQPGANVQNPVRPLSASGRLRLLSEQDRRKEPRTRSSPSKDGMLDSRIRWFQSSHVPRFQCPALPQFLVSAPAVESRPAQFCRPEIPTALSSRHSRGRWHKFCVWSGWSRR